ncbi:hypothetical protein [Mucilaginibacter sp.]|uniref:hypothetical protein n=1 Tax=Mucilaginibacter sp. TaxID=1882438 RepID=UPI0026163391|nr:hypothetical protein [Mucilaginibacter sp.]MDB4926250.1 hypothetical protein [Mucilaginibacter sp.]
MDHFREIKNCLTWHNEGKFEVELINGIITRLNFCEPGKGTDDTGKCLTSVNYKYLQAVHSCLGDLFTFIEEENKRLGYSYAREVEIAQYHTGEEIHDNYQSETKLRPLINYNHQLDENPIENKESLVSQQDRTQQDIELIA